MKRNLIYFVVILLFHCVLTGTAGAADLKVFISPFSMRGNLSEYAFYSIALPRSIRATIEKKLVIIAGERELSSDELTRAGYAFQIKGIYTFKNERLIISFSMIHLRTNRAIVVTFVRGYADNRVFTLVDSLSKLILESIQKPVPELIKNTIIMTIKEDGNIVLGAKGLAGMDLSSGIFTGADFSRRDMRRVNFQGANLQDVILQYSNLNGSNMSGANLTGVSFMGADVTGVDFRRAIGIEIEDNLELARGYRNAIYDDEIREIINLPKFYIGFSIAPGMTFNQYNLIENSDVYTRFTGSVSARMLLHLGANFALIFDAGYQAMRSKEILGNSFKEYNLHYLFMSFSPAILIKNFYFCAGLYFNFLLAGKYTNQLETISDRKLFNPFNIGVLIGMGYRFRLSSKIVSLIGVELKNQLSNALSASFTRNTFLGIYINFGLLFET